MWHSNSHHCSTRYRTRHESHLINYAWIYCYFAVTHPYHVTVYSNIQWIGHEQHTFCQHIDMCLFNTLRPRQNERHFADDNFTCIFLNKNVWKPIEISLKFVPQGPINNIPALVQIMAWRRSGDKPLSELMIFLLTHICVTRPQWVNTFRPWQQTLQAFIRFILTNERI